MAKIVREIMNRELFGLRQSDGADDALGYLLALGISGAPLLTADRRPLGVVSLRDLVATNHAQSALGCMTAPAVTISEEAGIDQAARLLAEKNVHRLIVVDVAGKAIGVASALDVVRALVGLPVPHPDGFPHLDRELSITWTNDTLLELEQIEVAPDGPGVFALIHGGSGRTERLVWAGWAENLRARLYDLLSRPQQESAELSRLLEHPGELRFKAASVGSARAREAIAEALMSRVRASRRPEPIRNATYRA